MLKSFKALYSNETLAEITRSLQENSGSILLYGLNSLSQKALYLGLTAASLESPFLFITYGHNQAEKLYDEVINLFADLKIGFFPANEGAFYDIAAASSDLSDRRLEVLLGLLRGELQGVITYADALLQPLLPPETMEAQSFHFKIGERIDLNSFLSTLIGQGYERTITVDTPGTFAQRGGIIDIYPPLEEYPVRLELFDEEIDSIRLFDPITQRSMLPQKEYILTPGFEFVITEEAKLRGQELLNKDFQDSLKRLEKTEPESAAKLSANFDELMQAIEQGQNTKLSSYFQYFYQQRASLKDYFQTEPWVCLDEPSRIQEAGRLREKELADYNLQGYMSGELLRGRQKVAPKFDDLVSVLASEPNLAMTMALRRPLWLKPKLILDNHFKTIPVFAGSLPLIVEEFERWIKYDFKITILAEDKQRAEQVKNLLEEYQFKPYFSDQQLAETAITISLGSIGEGIEITAPRQIILPDSTFFTKSKRRTFKKSSDSRKVRTHKELTQGDLVVHVNHGIGRYMGVTSLELDGMQKDYLYIQYAGEDKLYVPIDQIDMVQKYIGSGESENIKLTGLHTNEWSRTTNRVKKAVKKMAINLLELYAKRQTSIGYAFSPDTTWQQELEDDFLYEETEDQLRSIEEIKADMERAQPMERLLCGDVGFGKTEVAIRAAFKAVTDGKQVAVLVPTTVLAQQHFLTFRERLAKFPINVDMMSRYRRPKENKETIQRLKKKQTDIVIGTHRLLSKDVEFADLGLLIIDEEQRFGVAHKEKLKSLKANVDVLMLSATPIPRTLHMSLMGIRDMSMIETPPENRFPIQTYVLEHNNEVIKEAIQRELERQGQVFVVHNRIGALPALAEQLKKLVPEGRFIIAHGQMPEGQLAQTMSDFLNREYDVLISTTIIEAGLDMPNVNTLLVLDADRYGLSQLHQLRGRIGRSSRIGYAYFMFVKDKVLSEISQKRLAALKEFTRLGEGYKIALRDLQMRGVGNILGAEQHGNVAAVGFELYSLMLKEEVDRLKGVVAPKKVETLIELKVDAFIPSEYIKDVEHKVDFYRRIQTADLDDLSEMEDEMLDRFGDLPLSVRHLLAIAKLRLLAAETGISQISQRSPDVVSFRIEGKDYSLNDAALLVLAMKNKLRHQPDKLSRFLLYIGDLSPTEILQEVETFVLGFSRIAKS